jgi:kynureninase
MINTNFHSSLEFAKKMDSIDPLKDFRAQFKIPPREDSKGECHYLCGNSLGLMPASVESALIKETQKWSKLAVEGHFLGDKPWYSYHEALLNPSAQVVGGHANEIVIMNSLTTNLHMMMVSFYRPTKKRRKILIEKRAFPSDYFAVCSQIKFHDLSVEDCLVEIAPRAGEDTIHEDDIFVMIEELGEELALVLLSGVQYLTGQVFPMEEITKNAHQVGALVGFDLAHAVGNVELHLHQWGVDFAVWCTYKYLNSGPGSIAGAFINERHLSQKNIPRFEGWWGHNKNTRFLMSGSFDPIDTAEAWQLSNPPIFLLAALGSSLEIFSQTKMEELTRKSRLLTGLLNFLIEEKLGNKIKIITPKNTQQRGCQLSLAINWEEVKKSSTTVSSSETKEFVHNLKQQGIICDFRHPNILRVAPAPLYNTYYDVWTFVNVLESILV